MIWTKATKSMDFNSELGFPVNIEGLYLEDSSNYRPEFPSINKDGTFILNKPTSCDVSWQLGNGNSIKIPVTKRINITYELVFKINDWLDTEGPILSIESGGSYLSTWTVGDIKEALTSVGSPLISNLLMMVTNTGEVCFNGNIFSSLEPLTPNSVGDKIVLGGADINVSSFRIYEGNRISKSSWNCVYQGLISPELHKYVIRHFMATKNTYLSTSDSPVFMDISHIYDTDFWEGEVIGEVCTEDPEDYLSYVSGSRILDHHSDERYVYSCTDKDTGFTDYYEDSEGLELYTGFRSFKVNRGLTFSEGRIAKYTGDTESLLEGYSIVMTVASEGVPGQGSNNINYKILEVPGQYSIYFESLPNNKCSINLLTPTEEIKKFKIHRNSHTIGISINSEGRGSFYVDSQLIRSDIPMSSNVPELKFFSESIQGSTSTISNIMILKDQLTGDTFRYLSNNSLGNNPTKSSSVWALWHFDSLDKFTVDMEVIDQSFNERNLELDGFYTKENISSKLSLLNTLT